MNWVTIIWSMVASACLTLAAVNLVVWYKKSTARANLLFSSTAVAVVDLGHGIEPEKLPRLFEPFYTTKADGMAMGLSIAGTIIEAHHGHIWAENNAAGGAMFRVTLPVGFGGANHEPMAGGIR
jgi:signal transduction histidine kinase